MALTNHKSNKKASDYYPQFVTPTAQLSKYKHIITGCDEKGKPFQLIRFNNNPLTITRSIIMYFTKRNYALLGDKKVVIN